TQVSGNESFAFDLFSVSAGASAVDGCTDPTADNYDPAATNDDGSCIFSGCTDPTALNYDMNANNDDGSCVFTVPAIVINEIHYNGNDGAGFPDTGVEFLEIYNNDAVSVDLSDWTLNGVTFTFAAGTMIAPDEYMVIALDPTNAIFTGATYQLFQFSGALTNGGELVQILDNNGIVVDEVTYDDGGAWPTAPDGAGPSLELINVDFDNNDGNSWCGTGGDNGTPGMVNSCAAADIFGCTDPTALNYNPAATADDGSCVFSVPAIVINELHYNPCTAQGDDTTYEFLELYNNEGSTVDLSGWSFSDGVEFTFPMGSSIAADEYIIVCVDATAYSGNGYQVFQWTSGGLGNTSELVALVDDSGSLVDQVTYSDSAPWPPADGDCNSLELVDVNSDNEDPANWQSAFVDNGTPGMANSTMPAATSYTVFELQSEVHTGETVVTNGVVTGVYAASNLFTIQDGSGAFSGIWVSGSGVVIGDEVDVTGQVVESFDLTLIQSTMVSILTSGNALPAAEILTTVGINAEDWEGVLVSVLGNVDNGDVGFGEWSVNDGSGSALVDDLAYLFTPAPDGISFNVVGPLYYSFG
ncbi:MAG: lamin tail domain-containing protein, partial [Bacteroidota bacterium]